MHSEQPHPSAKDRSVYLGGLPRGLPPYNTAPQARGEAQRRAGHRRGPRPITPRWALVVIAACTLAALPPSTGQAQPAWLEAPPQPTSPPNDAPNLPAHLEQWRTRTNAMEDAWSKAPQVLGELRKELDDLRKLQPEQVDGTLPASELEQQLRLAELQLSSTRKQSAQLREELEQLETRHQALPQQLLSARARLQELQERKRAGLTGPDTGQASSPTGQPGTTVHMADVLAAEVLAYETELKTHDSRVEVLASRQQLNSLKAEQAAERVELLRTTVSRAKRRQASEEAARARAMLTTGWPDAVQQTIRELANRNAELAEQWAGSDGLVEQSALVVERLARARAQVAAVEAEYERITAQVGAGGNSDSVGALLRRQRAEVPDVGMFERFVRMRQETRSQAHLEQLRLQDERERLKDIDRLVTELLESLEPELPDETQRRQVREVFLQLLHGQRRYLDLLVADYDEYLRKLLEFDMEQRKLVERSQQLIDFIDERVLWVPSGRAIGPHTLGNAREAVQWLVDPTNLGQLARASQQSFRDSPLIACAILLLLVLNLPLRLRIQTQVASHAPQHPTATRTLHGARAVALSFGYALLPPLGLLAAAHDLETTWSATLYVRSLAFGFKVMALAWLSLRLVNVTLWPQGLAQAHAAWPQDPCTQLRKRLRWLTLGLLPATWLVATVEARGEDTARESLGRLALALACVGLAAFGQWALRPAGPLRDLLHKRQPHLSQRQGLLPMLQALATFGPLLITLAALGGYTWTAMHLAVRLHITLTALYMLFLLSDLLHAWARAARQRVIEARREAELRTAMAGPQPSPDAHGQPGLSTDTKSDQALDIATVSDHTRRLIRLSLLGLSLLIFGPVWIDLLPAAGILHDVEVWQTVKDVVVTIPQADGTESRSSQPQEVPVTLADLARGLLLAGFAWMLIRNLPGLIEVTLFRRLHAGERYAYTTIIKYAIGVAGVSLCMDALGVDWSSIQWLVAAVGLGLGFGLQEIFANFISGLIILFERPVRVGDMVTVGDVSGTVSRIHIRATWITAFDRKELVVPNRELVTNRLINWSLSDNVVRLTVAVGIAYGSDTEKVVQVLREVAQNHPQILHEPTPQVLFLEFGDNALGFELRAFTGTVTSGLSIRHELHMAVEKALRAAGIVIAFPQRDVRVHWQRTGETGEAQELP